MIKVIQSLIMAYEEIVAVGHPLIPNSIKKNIIFPLILLFFLPTSEIIETRLFVLLNLLSRVSNMM